MLKVGEREQNWISCCNKENTFFPLQSEARNYLLIYLFFAAAFIFYHVLTLRVELIEPLRQADTSFCGREPEIIPIREPEIIWSRGKTKQAQIITIITSLVSQT